MCFQCQVYISSAEPFFAHSLYFCVPKKRCLFLIYCSTGPTAFNAGWALMEHDCVRGSKYTEKYIYISIVWAVLCGVGHRYYWWSSIFRFDCAIHPAKCLLYYIYMRLIWHNNTAWWIDWPWQQQQKQQKDLSGSGRGDCEQFDIDARAIQVEVVGEFDVALWQTVIYKYYVVVFKFKTTKVIHIFLSSILK